MSDVISPVLKENGLNMLAVFDLKTLPSDMLTALATATDLSRFRQLLVFGHAGGALWQALKESEFYTGKDPIDRFSQAIVQQYFDLELPAHHVELLYPNTQRLIPLQRLGELAGWHHPSPFRIGINEKHGSWFAYRVVALADTHLKTTTRNDSQSPCDSCSDKPCISACPAKALVQGDLSLKTCISYRLHESSLCKAQCISRITCPVAKELRYDKEQINYHYNTSLQAIQDYTGSIS